MKSNAPRPLLEVEIENMVSIPRLRKVARTRMMFKNSFHYPSEDEISEHLRARILSHYNVT